MKRVGLEAFGFKKRSCRGFQEERSTSHLSTSSSQIAPDNEGQDADILTIDLGDDETLQQPTSAQVEALLTPTQLPLNLRFTPLSANDIALAINRPLTDLVLVVFLFIRFVASLFFLLRPVLLAIWLRFCFFCFLLF